MASWKDNKTVGLSDVDRTSINNIRVWSSAEDNMRVIAMKGSYEETANSWTLSEGLYYYDVTHNLGSNDLIVETYIAAEGLSVGMEDLERTSTNNLRVWSATNTEDIRVVILSI